MKFLTIALFFTLVAATLADRQAFESYKRLHGRSYDPEEEDKRYQIFLKNKAEIDAHNANPEKTYEQGYYEHMDMEYDEFKDKYLKTTPQKVDGIEPFDHKLFQKKNCSTNFNWVNYGLVSQVKNQGQCGSCWTYGTTGVLEGALASGKKINLATHVLSEQNILDCTPPEAGSKGCSGGWPASTLQYLKSKGSIAYAANYPYIGFKSSCKNVAGVRLSIDKIFQVKPNDEKALVEAICKYGPITVAVNANKNFSNYRGGIFNDPTCNSQNINHAVLLTGWGVDDKTGKQYWIVKNTWDITWGERGYMRLARNANNMCWVASHAYAVTLN